MNRILLIRHGITDLSNRVLYGRTGGIHLNEQGRRQAAVISAALKERYRLEAVISSPLERAMETAEPIAKAYDTEIVVEDGLLEVDFGAWVGLSFGELSDMSPWQEFNQLRSLRCAPQGESMMEVQARAWRAVEKVTARTGKDSSLAIVSHGDVIRCLLVLVLGISIDHLHRLEVAPGSVSEVLVGESDPVVRGINRIYE